MPITIDEPEVKRMYIGTRFADKVEKGVQNLMIGAASKVQDWSKDQEGIHDDALRLMGGGIKNLRNWSKDQEGVGDDILRLAGGGIGNALKIAGFAGEVGGWAGGKIAGAAGFDPRIGRTVGGVLGDVIPIAGVGAKALQISKTARRMNRLTRQGHGLQISQVLRASKGKPYAFAYGDAGKDALKINRSVGDNIKGAIGANKKARKTFGKLDNQATVERMALEATKPGPKVNAVTRYDYFDNKGYNVKHLRNQAEKLRKSDHSEKLEGLTQWTDEAAYRKRAQDLYDAGLPSADIRQTVGVYVNPKTGEVRQMMSRKKGRTLDLRNPWGEGANTTLNRRLSLVQQQAKGTPGYSTKGNVEELMKQMKKAGTLDSSIMNAPAKEQVAAFKKFYAIHHKRSIVAYEPFFYDLDAKDAARLRKMIHDKSNIKLGDDIDNLVAIPKSKHTLDKDSIHTWMRENGIEGVSKEWEGIVGSYDAQASLRTKFVNASVKQRYKAFKLYLEYVQEPTDTALNKLLATMKQ